MDKIDRRQAIIEAARKRFHHYGVRKTTMQEIAEDMNLAVGTLYLYFKNKDELIVGCAGQFWEAHQAFADTVLQSDSSADEKLRQYAINRFRAVKEVRAGTSHTAEIARTASKLDPASVHEDNRRMHQTVLKILTAGIEESVFHAVDPAKDAEVFLQALTYFLPVSETEPSRNLTEAKLCQTLDWFIEKWSMTDRPKRRARDESQDFLDAMRDRPGPRMQERRSPDRRDAMHDRPGPRSEER